MVCKKCKTALEENAKVCPYCKTKLDTGRHLVMIGLLCGMVAVTGATFWYLSRAEDGETPQAEPPIEQPAQNGQNGAPPQESAPGQAEAVQPEELIQQFLSPEPTPTPPAYAADTSMQEDEVWALVESMAVTANDYYDRSHDTRVIISKNGYMYNYPAKNYYTPKNFEKIESMNPQYADEQVLLLYVRPGDMAELLPDASPSESALTLYCAFETRDGFAVAERGGRLGVIPHEGFQKLLAKYSDERGGAFRPDNDSQEFADIVAGVAAFKNSAAGFDARYVTYDGKYAFAVLSEKNAPEALQEFLLIRGENGGWAVDFSGFETTFMYQKAINDKYPDFNIGMLPPYNLYYSAKDIRSNISPLVDAMRTQGLVSAEDGRDTFATGTDKYCYIEFETGKKLLAVYAGEGKGWMVHNINNFLHAEMIMATYEENAPTFILKQ